jgi:predicted ATPase
MDWSFDLLTDAERELFCQLSVFRGGFELAAAEMVSARRDGSDPRVVNLLGQLIAKSLVTRDDPSDEVEGASRYRMLETIREYSREKLDDSGGADEFRNRHLE